MTAAPDQYSLLLNCSELVPQCCVNVSTCVETKKIVDCCRSAVIVSSCVLRRVVDGLTRLNDYQAVSAEGRGAPRGQIKIQISG
jgi:hypothetical protein